MLISWRVRAYGFGLLGWVLSCSGATAAGEPPKIKHVTVYREAGRFAGWPANHGMWSWGDEILVGFSRGYYKDRGPFHHINKEKPEEFLLARSLDGGITWSIEQPRPPGALAGTPGMRHGLMPPGVSPEQPTDLTRPDRFHAPRFRHDDPHGEHERRNVAFLFFVRSRPCVARPIQTAAVRPTRGHGPHRHDRERPERLLPLSDRLEGQQSGRPAVLRPDDRRRAHLALPLVHRARTDRLLHHALDGASLRDRPRDDHPAARQAQELDRCLCVTRRWPDLVVLVHARARYRRGQPAQPAPSGRRPAVA